MNKRLTILLSSYACGPNVGSEPGVGWAWVKHLLTRYNVIVFTTTKYKKEIEKSDLYNNADFYFIGTNRLVEFLFPKLSRWKYYIWQYYAYKWAREILKEKSVDLIHHVTFIQYFTPAFGFFLDLPFVFGPIGGGEIIPAMFFRELGISTLLKELFRRLFIFLARYLFHAYPQNRAYYIFANPSTKQIINNNSNKLKSYILPAIYIDQEEINDLKVISMSDNEETKISDKLKLILPTRLLDWKGIIFGLRSIKGAINKGVKIELQIIGDGPLKNRIKRYINKSNLDNEINLLRRISRNELLKVYNEADALFYPAFRDSGAMVVAEAYLSNKPAIVLNIDSQFYLDEEFSYKADICSSYNETLKSMIMCLIRAYNERHLLNSKGKEGRVDLIKKLSWSAKIDEISRIYYETLTKENYD